jgi:hypothetical protein
LSHALWRSYALLRRGCWRSPARPSQACRRSHLTRARENCGFWGGRTDYSIIKPQNASPQELPTWRIPNVPSSAEAYYAPDNYHVIAQTQDPDGAHTPAGSTGALTWIFSDDGKTKWRVNDRGQDLCSYFFPDGKRVIFTSTRDHMDFPLGNVSDERNYPQGTELYIADIDPSRPTVPRCCLPVRRAGIHVGALHLRDGHLLAEHRSEALTVFDNRPS